MDDSKMTAEQACVLYELAEVLMDNERAEAEAVRGYTVQAKLIDKAKALFAENEAFMGLLDRLAAETEEKTQDELSHGKSLYAEYTELTGIVPKED